MTDLHPEALTWTALLGRWIEFAQASLAIPDDDDGARWRASVPAIINLQAVTFALGELDTLAPADRPLARDRAAILVRDNVQLLEATWPGRAMSPMLLDVVADARRGLDLARYAGAVELVWPGPGTMEMPDVAIGEPLGTLAIMQPGTIVNPGEPVAWWVDRPPLVVEGCDPRPTRHPDQVYRQIDEEGVIVRDVVAPIESALPAGLPLLVPLFEDGHPIGRFTLDPATWARQQRQAWPDEGVPVYCA